MVPTLGMFVEKIYRFFLSNAVLKWGRCFQTIYFDWGIFSLNKNLQNTVYEI
jgi:hypothetical protein